MRTKTVLAALALLAALYGCSRDVVSPGRRTLRLADLVSQLRGDSVFLGSVLHTPSPAERALRERLLARFPRGDGRWALQDVLDGHPGLMIGRTRVEGDPVAQALLDSIRTLRSAGRGARSTLRERTLRP